MKLDFSGSWISSFRYVNKLEPDGAESTYEVRIYKTGNQLVIQSVDNPDKNYFVSRLTLDDDLRMLTGTWQENSSPTGKYNEKVFYGVGMLHIDDNGNSMSGKIIEYNDDLEIISGDWEVNRS